MKLQLKNKGVIMNCNTNHPSRTKLIAASLLSVSSLALMAMPVHAQQTVETEEAEDEEEKVIFVTGSRIAVDSTTSAASPIIVVDAEAIQTTGEADLATLLRDIPAVRPKVAGLNGPNSSAKFGARTAIE